MSDYIEDDTLDELFDGLGLLVTPTDNKKKPGNNFAAVVETLERVGRVEGETIRPVCHIMEDNGHYAILHAKEVYDLRNGTETATEVDIRERNYIANILNQWKLISIHTRDKIQMVDEGLYASNISLVPYAKKRSYKIMHEFPEYTQKQKKEETIA